MKDYYRILMVPRTASLDQIKKAFRALALTLHPDITKGDKRKEIQFREVAEAFETLGNTTLRSQYDRALGARSGAFSSSSSSSSSAANRSDTAYRPQGRTVRPVSASQFNINEWNANHYGDDVNEVEADPGAWMTGDRPHQQYYEQKVKDARRRDQMRPEKDCCIA